MKKETLANFAAASAALSAGASVVATRLVVAETDPVTLALYRYVIATTCIAPVLIARWPTCSMPLRDTATIASLGALFFGFFPWAFSAALQYTTAARGAIGIATIPIQTLILAVFLGREVLTYAKLLSVSLAFVGVVVAFGSAAFSIKRPDYLIGDGLMLLGALSAAIYSVLARPVLQRYDSLFVTGCGMVFGALALLPLAALAGAVSSVPRFTVNGWFALLFLGTIGGALQFGMFMWALRWLPPIRTVIYLTLNPMSAMFLAAVYLDEAITIYLVIGLGLVMSGIFLTNRPQAMREST
jgi:drug/metabolite transporter (DMT)-like permease